MRAEKKANAGSNTCLSFISPISQPLCTLDRCYGVGLGIVLKQDGHIIAYASRTLNKPEQYYSVIQKECLAVVFAQKQFCHCLLGRPFRFIMDQNHCSGCQHRKWKECYMLRGFSNARILLHIKDQKGSLNSNADALFSHEATQHVSAATQIQVTESKGEPQQAQQADSNIRKVADALPQSNKQPIGKCGDSRYHQL